MLFKSVNARNERIVSSLLICRRGDCVIPFDKDRVYSANSMESTAVPVQTPPICHRGGANGSLRTSTDSSVGLLGQALQTYTIPELLTVAIANEITTIVLNLLLLLPSP